MGKYLNLNKRGTTRVNLSLGLGYTAIKEPENWQKISKPLLDNYTWSYKLYNTVSLIINPKIDFPFTRIFGSTISPMLQINKDRAYFGIGIGSMIGLLRKTEKKN